MLKCAVPLLGVYSEATKLKRHMYSNIITALFTIART